MYGRGHHGPKGILYRVVHLSSSFSFPDILTLSLPDHFYNACSPLLPHFLSTFDPRNCNDCSPSAFVWTSSAHPHPFHRPLLTSCSCYPFSLQWFTRISVKPETDWHQLTQRIIGNIKYCIPFSTTECRLLSSQTQLKGEQCPGIQA